MTYLRGHRPVNNLVRHLEFRRRSPNGSWQTYNELHSSENASPNVYGFHILHFVSSKCLCLSIEKLKLKVLTFPPCSAAIQQLHLSHSFQPSAVALLHNNHVLTVKQTFSLFAAGTLQTPGSPTLVALLCEQLINEPFQAAPISTFLPKTPEMCTD